MNIGTKLLVETKKLLANRPASLEKKEIANATGVSLGWINTFMRGEIKNPGINTIGKLNEYLKNHKVE